MNIRNIYRKNKTEGLVGIEIEVEGRRLPEDIKGWHREHDGSLRGESAEYVLIEPCMPVQVKKLLGNVAEAYKESESEINESERTSVHIHVNVQDFTITQVYNFITLYAAFEDALLRFCGDSRIGNLFCLRIRDAEFLPIALEDSLRKERLAILGSDQLRYAAINVTALEKFGSLEFRSMRGTEDMGLIQTWIEILLKIRAVAQFFNDPAEIIHQISIMGQEGFSGMVFDGMEDQLDIQAHEVMEGARFMQDCAFSVNWKDVEQRITARYGK